MNSEQKLLFYLLVGTKHKPSMRVIQFSYFCLAFSKGTDKKSKKGDN